MAINGSSDVLCFEFYLMITFAKSSKSERCTDVSFKVTLHGLSVSVEGLNS